MHRINKILSVFLITATLFGICTFAYADNERADVDYEIKAKADFLQRLGIIDNDFDDSTLESDLTRGEFAIFVARANKLASAIDDNVRYFVDIDSNSECFESVSALIENNIISSADDGRFRPNDTITYYEACVMLVNSLGYKGYALANGGYPSGYLKAARKAKLNGYNSDSGVSVSDGISLLYDALSAESYNIDSIGADGNTYSRNGDTWLYNSFRLKSEKGSVESVYGATLYFDKVSDEGYILISGKQYSVSDGFDNSNLIGSYVDFFYNEDKYEVFFALENTAAKEAEMLDISLLNNFSDNRISFYANENSSKILSYALDEDAISVYNGMPLTSDVENIISNLKNTKGYITLKDSDASGGYDAVIIESYRGFLINSYDSENGVIYNRIKAYDSIDVSDESFVRIIDTNGNVLTKDSIKSKLLINAAVSVDGKMSRIIICDNVIDDKIVAIDDENAKIGDREYKLDAYFKDNLKSSVVLGQTYKIYIDSFGEIVFVDTADSRKMKYGYLVKAAADDGFDQTIKLKIFTEDGEMKVFECSENVKVDAVSFKDKTAESVLEYFNGVRLIEFTEDNSGRINEIDTAKVRNAAENKDYSLRPVFENAELEQWYRDKRFGIVSLFGDSTIAFFVPKNNSGEKKDYSIGVYSEHFPYDNAISTAEVYYRSDDSAYIDVMVSITDTEKLDGETSVIMVDSVGEGLDSDGNIVFQIEGYDNDAKFTVIQMTDENCFTVENDIRTIVKLKKGDLVIARRNNLKDNNIFAEAERVYSPSEIVPKGFHDNGQGLLLFATGENVGQTQGYKSGTQISFGYVKRKFDSGVVTWSPIMGDTAKERANIGKGKVVLYNSKTEDVGISDVSEILDFDNAGKECSKIFYKTWIGVPDGVFIYN